MPTLINVCGNGRTGSTMIGLMLENGANAFNCGEVYAWFRPYRTHHYKIRCTCKQDPCPYWERIKNSDEKVFHKTVCDELGVEFVIDSSKEHTWVVDSHEMALKNDMQVINLVLWKEPISIAFSHWKRGRSITKELSNYIKWYRWFFNLGLPFFSISYEELAAEPGRKIKDICNIIGMSYFKGKENFWDVKSHYLFGSLGMRKQLESDTLGHIQQKRNYPQEFRDHFGKMESKIVKNSELKSVLSHLKTHEVSIANKIDFLNTTNYYGQLGVLKKYNVKPWWYYLRKVRWHYKKYFPEYWPHEQ